MTSALTPSETMKITCSHAGAHQLHVLKWRACNSQGLPPVVCVHGLTRRAEDFRRLANALSQTRDVYAFSMAGRGESDRVKSENYGYELYVADCRELLKSLELTTVDWVGTSMGGIIGMLIAGNPESPIRRLVLNDIGPFISVEALKSLVQHVTGYDGTPFKSEADAHSYCAATYAGFGICGTSYWQELLDVSVVRDADGVLRLHHDPHVVDALRDPAATAAPVDLWSSYDRITAPTLTLRGVYSGMLTQETAEEMMRHGPRTVLVTFSGCGHAPALVQPEQIGTIQGFLNQ